MGARAPATEGGDVVPTQAIAGRKAGEADALRKG